MPCRTDGLYDDLLQPRADLLCSACRALEASGFDFATNPELDRWWAAHKKEDELRQLKEARERQERLEALALAGTKLVADLTPRERDLLRKHHII